MGIENNIFDATSTVERGSKKREYLGDAFSTNLKIP